METAMEGSRCEKGKRQAKGSSGHPSRASGRRHLHHENGHGGEGCPLASDLHQGGGASSTGEGHHQHAHQAAGLGMALGLGQGLIQKLAIADGASTTAKAAPIGRESLHRPAELISGGGDGLIRSTGSAMEEEMDRAAIGAGEELAGDQGHRPGQITATTGHDHKGTGRGHHRQR